MDGEAGPALLDVPTDVSMVVSDLPVIGDSRASVIVIEFSDFECPFCRRYARTVFADVEREFIVPGRVRYAFAHFPLESIHSRARLLAEAAVCAGRQGRFWEMHDLLFDLPASDDTTLLEAVVAEAGLQADQVLECLQEGGQLSEVIDRDIQVGRRLGIAATPSFVIGQIDKAGHIRPLKLIRGAQSVEWFRRAIKEVSDEASPRRSEPSAPESIQPHR